MIIAIAGSQPCAFLNCGFSSDPTRFGLKKNTQRYSFNLKLGIRKSTGCFLNRMKPDCHVTERKSKKKRKMNIKHFYFADCLLHSGHHHRQHRQPGQHGDLYHHPEGLGGGCCWSGQQQACRSVSHRHLLIIIYRLHMIHYRISSPEKTLNPGC